MSVHKYYFDLKHKNGTKKVEIEGYKDKSTAYVNMREKICSNLNISIREFENTYDLIKSKHKIEFDPKPWNSSSELISDIESISNINNASFVPSYNRHHKPPKILVDLNDMSIINKTKKDIKSYCKDFSFCEKNNNFYIVLDPR